MFKLLIYINTKTCHVAVCKTNAYMVTPAYPTRFTDKPQLLKDVKKLKVRLTQQTT